MCQTGALTHLPDSGPRLLGEVPSSVKVTSFESDELAGAGMSAVIVRILEAFRRGVLGLPLHPVKLGHARYARAVGVLDSEARTGRVVVTVP